MERGGFEEVSGRRTVWVVATEGGKDSSGNNESQLVSIGTGTGAKGRFGERRVARGVVMVEC